MQIEIDFSKHEEAHAGDGNRMEKDINLPPSAPGTVIIRNCESGVVFRVFRHANSSRLHFGYVARNSTVSYSLSYKTISTMSDGG